MKSLFCEIGVVTIKMETDDIMWKVLLNQLSLIPAPFTSLEDPAWFCIEQTSHINTHLNDKFKIIASLNCGWNICSPKYKWR